MIPHQSAAFAQTNEPSVYFAVQVLPSHEPVAVGAGRGQVHYAARLAIAGSTTFMQGRVATVCMYFADGHMYVL